LEARDPLTQDAVRYASPFTRLEYAMYSFGGDMPVSKRKDIKIESAANPSTAKRKLDLQWLHGLLTINNFTVEAGDSIRGGAPSSTFHCGAPTPR